MVCMLRLSQGKKNSAHEVQLLRHWLTYECCPTTLTPFCMGPPAPLKETKYFTFTIFNPFYSKTFILKFYRFVFASFSFRSSSAMLYQIGAEITDNVISNISAVRFTYHIFYFNFHSLP